MDGVRRAAAAADKHWDAYAEHGRVEDLLAGVTADRELDLLLGA